MPRFLNGHAIICAFALGCSAEGRLRPVTPPDHVQVLVEEAESRILSMTDPVGWVVSRWQDDARPEHTGDSAFFTAIAMGVSSCKVGDVFEDALLGMLNDGNGYVYRHPTQKDREASFDPHMALYWGVKHRVERCPEARPFWIDALATHQPVNVPEVFSVVLDAVRHDLGVGPAPSSGRLRDLAAVTSSWAALVQATKAAGYRIHLGLLALETAGADRGAFCAATRGAGLLTVEHFCGRDDLAQWIQGFEWNVYEYRFQRAKWESADGKDGLETPGVDLRVALRKAYDR